MFDTHLPKKRGKIVAVADVGSASAALALVALHPGAPAQVLAAERSILPAEERSKEATIAAIGEHLVLAGEKTAKAYAAKAGGAASVKELYCIIHAPWSRSVTAQAVSKSEKEVSVTQGTIAALAKAALGNQTQLDTKNILEAGVVRVALNGYPTGSPIGKRAREVEVRALVSDCDAALRAQVQTSLQKLFPHLTPAFRSSTRAIFAILSGRPEADRDYLIVDVVGEATTLVSVLEGAIAEQHLVQEGTRGMLKRLAPGGMPEETLGLLRMIERDQCSSAACESVLSAIAKVEPELVRVFGEGMAACAARQRLPNKIILIAQSDIVPWLTKFFSRIDFSQFTLTAQPFSVETIGLKDLSAHIVSPPGVVPDTGIALSVALVNSEQRGR